MRPGAAVDRSRTTGITSDRKISRCLKNSYRNVPRSGLLFLCGEVGFKLRRGQVADGGVKTLLVVDLVEKRADFTPRLRQIPVFIAMNLLMFQGFHEGFARCVVPRIALTRHADLDAVFLKQAG